MSFQIAEGKQPLILTSGVYDLIKDHVRRKKVIPQVEQVLKSELKTAMQVPRRSLPSNVVSINARVTVKDHTLNKEESFVFVAPHRAKRRNNTHSILSPMGLALVGYKAGDTVTWAFDDGEHLLEVLSVESLES